MSLTPEMMPAWELLPIVKEQAVRIAQLEAALRMIRDREPRGLSWSVHVARAALGEERT
jgi:hypothetical protein